MRLRSHWPERAGIVPVPHNASQCAPHFSSISTQPLCSPLTGGVSPSAQIVTVLAATSVRQAVSSAPTDRGHVDARQGRTAGHQPCPHRRPDEGDEGRLTNFVAGTLESGCVMGNG